MRASSSEVATVKIRTGHISAVHAAVGSALEQAWSCDLEMLTVVAVDDRNRDGSDLPRCRLWVTDDFASDEAIMNVCSMNCQAV